MAKKIRVTTRALPRVEHSGTVLRRVQPDDLAKAIGAERVSGLDIYGGSPIGLFALRRELASRLRSSGGRPALVGATRRTKIPMSDDEWARIERIAVELSRNGVNATAGQVASTLLHLTLEAVVESDASGISAFRVVCARLVDELTEVKTLHDYLRRIPDRSQWVAAFNQHRKLFPGIVDRVGQQVQNIPNVEQPEAIDRALVGEASRLGAAVDTLRARIAECAEPVVKDAVMVEDDGETVSRV